jgi:hypothetical protein
VRQQWQSQSKVLLRSHWASPTITLCKE